MADTGKVQCGTGASVGSGDKFFTSVATDFSEITDATFGTHCACDNINEFESSNIIRGTNFGFSIPAGATIDGIVFYAELDAGAPQSLYHKNIIPYVTAGQKGTDKGLGTDAPPASLTEVSWGTSTDLWGTTWTVAEINSSDFGFGLSFVEWDDDIKNEIDCHSISAQVYYTEAVGGGNNLWPIT